MCDGVIHGASAQINLCAKPHGSSMYNSIFRPGLSISNQNIDHFDIIYIMSRNFKKFRIIKNSILTIFLKLRQHCKTIALG